MKNYKRAIEEVKNEAMMIVSHRVYPDIEIIKGISQAGCAKVIAEFCESFSKWWYKISDADSVFWESAIDALEEQAWNYLDCCHKDPTLEESSDIIEFKCDAILYNAMDDILTRKNGMNTSYISEFARGRGRLKDGADAEISGIGELGRKLIFTTEDGNKFFETEIDAGWVENFKLCVQEHYAQMVYMEYLDSLSLEAIIGINNELAPRIEYKLFDNTPENLAKVDTAHIYEALKRETYDVNAEFFTYNGNALDSISFNEFANRLLDCEMKEDICQWLWGMGAEADCHVPATVLYKALID